MFLERNSTRGDTNSAEKDRKTSEEGTIITRPPIQEESRAVGGTHPIGSLDCHFETVILLGDSLKLKIIAVKHIGIGLLLVES
jgi:hypothetical protein